MTVASLVSTDPALSWKTWFADGSSSAEERIEAAERELGVTFPRSYRAFLRIFGAAEMEGHVIYGLHAHSLRDDVVMMNHLAPRRVSGHLVKIAEDGDGRSYYLDTLRIDLAGECEVVTLVHGNEEKFVAASFGKFLWKVMAGLV